MLVKVKNKATGVEQCITQKAFNLAKKRYNFLGNCEDGADLDSYTESPQSESQESPNQKTTAPKSESESGKGAEAVGGKTKAKPGPKSTKTISSVASGTEK